MRSINHGRSSRCAGALLLALLAGFSVSHAAPSSAPADAWKSFTSSTGFSIQYPGDWVTRGGVTSYRLDIFSEPGGNNGSVFKHGQAAIVVSREPEARTIAAAIALVPKDTPVLKQQAIKKDIGGCRAVREVVHRLDFLDPKEAPEGYVPQQTDDFYCETGGTVIDVHMFYWGDDPKQVQWRKIALQMVASLKALY